MEKIKIQVPTIRYDDSGFNQILQIASQVMQDPKRSFDFDFSNCSRLDHHGVAILGGLARYVDYQNSKTERTIASFLKTKSFSTAGVMFLVDTMSSLISEHLIQNNFLSHFTQENFSGYPEGDYIGYREHNNQLHDDNIASHLNENWLSDEKISLSDLLKNAIVSRIFEIFMNAYGHGASVQDIKQLGIYSCGQYDKKEQKLNLTVLDFGPGIINNVKLNEVDINDDLIAMKWALKRGNSTRTDSKNIDLPRGLGFDLLKEFVKINDGEMRIYSNGVYAVVSGKSEVRVARSKYELGGTLVSIKINCDDRYYRFVSEAKENDVQFF